MTDAHEKGEAPVKSAASCARVETRRIKRTQEVSNRDRKGLRPAALGEIGRLAVTRHHCGYCCVKRLAHLIVLVFVGDLERLGGADHRLHGREDVLIDQFGETPFVLV